MPLPAQPSTPNTPPDGGPPPPKTSDSPDRFVEDSSGGEPEESTPLLVPPPPQTQIGFGTDAPEDIEERLELRSGTDVSRKGDKLFAFIAVVS